MRRELHNKDQYHVLSAVPREQLSRTITSIDPQQFIRGLSMYRREVERSAETGIGSHWLTSRMIMNWLNLTVHYFCSGLSISLLTLTCQRVERPKAVDLRAWSWTELSTLSFQKLTGILSSRSMTGKDLPSFGQMPENVMLTQYKIGYDSGNLGPKSSSNMGTASCASCHPNFPTSCKYITGTLLEHVNCSPLRVRLIRSRFFANRCLTSALEP